MFRKVIYYHTLRSCMAPNISVFKNIQANRTQDWCNKNLPDFISVKEWSAASPDLNPLDFCIWRYMRSKIGVTKGLTSLKIG